MGGERERERDRKKGSNNESAKAERKQHPKQQKGRGAIPRRRSLRRHAEVPQQGD